MDEEEVVPNESVTAVEDISSGESEVLEEIVKGDVTNEELFGKNGEKFSAFVKAGDLQGKAGFRKFVDYVKKETSSRHLRSKQEKKESVEETKVIGESNKNDAESSNNSLNKNSVPSSKENELGLIGDNNVQRENLVNPIPKISSTEPLSLSKKLEQKVKARIDKAANERNGKYLDLSGLGLISKDLKELIPIIKKRFPNLSVLDLRNNELMELPVEIGSLKKLKKLNLGNNKLTKLPEEVGSLKKLQRLGLGNNELTELPKEIWSLEELKGLYLENNKLTELPGEIGSLKKLQELDLDNNKLTGLPEEIGSLKELKNLYLENNEVTELPEEIGSLEELQLLDLTKNKLTELPGEIGSLKKLQALYLSYNKLTELPGEIGSLKQLQELNLDNNKLTELPKEIWSLKELQDLYLDNNELTGLPEEIGSLKELQVLDLEHNKLESIPVSLFSLSNLSSLDVNHNYIDLMLFYKYTNYGKEDLTFSGLVQYKKEECLLNDQPNNPKVDSSTSNPPKGTQKKDEQKEQKNPYSFFMFPSNILKRTTKALGTKTTGKNRNSKKKHTRVKL